MNEQSLLHAIEQLMDTKLLKMKDEILDETAKNMKIMEANILKESTHRMQVMLDTEVNQKFNLLADAIAGISEKLDAMVDPEKTALRLDTLEMVVKIHSQDIAQLKKAN